ncbi:MAG: single-stranded DNA-binding protein [Flavobacteriaceae bacterium]|nr:single-stranded DNA-binding protein [Flavobacteriaceae bacterium]MCY4216611.1 single-stranded DNA-binding protein [Flavobacteriaceae bacterium]MCY4253518.1 single-stranded DNA-binding protein [Flavobacteriaceae bacterium]
MNDANRVEIKGRLGQTPKFYTNKSGSMVILQVATHLRYMDKSGQWQQKTTWHNVKAFGPVAQKMQHANKGQEVSIKGRLENTTIQRDGKNHTYTNIIATSVEALPSQKIQREQSRN